MEELISEDTGQSRSGRHRRSQAEISEGSLISEFQLSHSRFALSDVLLQLPAVTVRSTRMTTTADSRLMTFGVMGPDLERFETGLSDSTTVSEATEIERTNDERVYRVTLTDDTRWFTSKLIQAGGRPLKITGSKEQWNVRAQFGSRMALRTFRDQCQDTSISFDLQQLYRANSETPRDELNLSRNQRETVEKAHRRGYFDVPRNISQCELANEFEISSSAVSQRLRRAISEILDETLSADDGSEP